MYTASFKINRDKLVLVVWEHGKDALTTKKVAQIYTGTVQEMADMAWEDFGVSVNTTIH